MVAIRQLTAEKFSVRLPSVLVEKFPEVRLQSCLPDPSSSLLTPETKLFSYRRLIVKVQFKRSRSFVLNVLVSALMCW